MDPFLFPPIAASLTAAYWVVDTIATLLEPLAAGASAALAIVVLTVLVRAALVPVGISQVKAEWTRRRLAPKLQALQRKSMRLVIRMKRTCHVGNLPCEPVHSCCRGKKTRASMPTISTHSTAATLDWKREDSKGEPAQ